MLIWFLVGRTKDRILDRLNWDRLAHSRVIYVGAGLTDRNPSRSLHHCHYFLAKPQLRDMACTPLTAKGDTHHAHSARLLFKIRPRRTNNLLCNNSRVSALSACVIELSGDSPQLSLLRIALNSTAPASSCIPREMRNDGNCGIAYRNYVWPAPVCPADPDDEDFCSMCFGRRCRLSYNPTTTPY